MEKIKQLSSLPLFNLVILFLVYLSVISVISSVAINYLIFRRQQSRTLEKRKCPVEAFTMILFFLMLSFLIKYKCGYIKLNNELLKRSLMVSGTVLILLGALFNIMARFNLGRYWSNDIRIYQEHRIITSGMFRLVRHPVFFSLLLMVIGASIIYINWITLSASLLIFLPGICFRAVIEEKFLQSRFPEYADYKKKTPMLIPFITNRRSKIK